MASDTLEIDLTGITVEVQDLGWAEAQRTQYALVRHVGFTPDEARILVENHITRSIQLQKLDKARMDLTEDNADFSRIVNEGFRVAKDEAFVASVSLTNTHPIFEKP